MGNAKLEVMASSFQSIPQIPPLSSRPAGHSIKQGGLEIGVESIPECWQARVERDRSKHFSLLFSCPEH